MTDWNAINQFIGSVIAWPGSQDEPGWGVLQYSYHDSRQSDGKFKGKYPVSPGKPYRDPTALCSFAGWLNSTANNKDVWFCTSLQAKTKTNKRGNVVGARSAMDALWQKSIWIDADVGPNDPKKYATFEEAMTAIVTFRKAVGLPRPSAIVKSGGGIHIYWISKTALSPQQWQPYASGLRNILLANNVKCDGGLTTDIARILRMPGTFNYKYDPPAPVELLDMPLKMYDFTKDLTVLEAFAGPIAAAPSHKDSHNLFAEGADMESFKAGPNAAFRGLREPDLNAGIDKFADNLIPLQDVKEIFKQCAFYNEASKTGGANHNQPLWNLAVLGTTFMEAGDAIAHAISKGHPEYSQVDTQALYDRKMAERHDRGIGYPSCETIKANGCGACETCPLRPKGKSPLNVRATVTATVTPKMGQSPAAVQVGLPSGFDLNAEGIICKVIEVTTKDGEDLPPEMIPLFQTKLYDFWAQKDPDCLNYTVDTDLGFCHHASVPHEEMSKTGFRAYLATARCRTMIDTRGKAFLEDFYLSMLGKMRSLAAAQMALPFGWYEENGAVRGFSFGGKIHMDDGTTRPCGIGDPNIKRNYTPTGDLNTWLKAAAVITGRKRPELTSILLMSLASPLAKMIAKDSVLFSAWGDSAAGKSAAYKVGMSVWGHSKLTKGSERSTLNNITTTMAEIKHLPFYWDEIEDDKHRETVAKIMHEASDGVEKGRNISGRETQKRGDWNLMIMVASNQSFKEFLYTRNKNHTASLARCLEWKVLKIDTGPGMMTDAAASALIAACESNYGRFGELYAAFLAQNHAAIKKEVVAEADKVEAFFGKNSEERYWQAGVASMICAARYAKQLGLDVDTDQILDFMYNTYAENRASITKRNMRGTITDRTDNVLARYLKARVSNDRVIWTNYMHNSVGRPPKPVVLLRQPQAQRNQQGGVECRFAVENNKLVIATTDFEGWLTEYKYQHTPINDGLEKDPYNAVWAKQLTLASGTPYQVTKEPCIVIQVKRETSLWDFMMLYATDDERAVMEKADPEEPSPPATSVETGFVYDANGVATASSVGAWVRGATGA